MRVDQNQKWHRGRCSASSVPQPHGAKGQCVCPCRGLKSCQFLSGTLLHPMPSLPGAECELIGNKFSMRRWGEQVSRELGKGKLPSQPCSGTVPVSNVLLSERSPPPQPVLSTPRHLLPVLHFSDPACSPRPLVTKPVAPLQQLDGVPRPRGHPCSSSVTPTGAKSHRS